MLPALVTFHQGLNHLGDHLLLSLLIGDVVHFGVVILVIQINRLDSQLYAF